MRPSNIAFLDAPWPPLAKEARFAERYARVDPRSSLLSARRGLEQLVDWLYEADATSPDARTSRPRPRAVIIASVLAWESSIIRSWMRLIRRRRALVMRSWARSRLHLQDAVGQPPAHRRAPAACDLSSLG